VTHDQQPRKRLASPKSGAGRAAAPQRQAARGAGPEGPRDGSAVASQASAAEAPPDTRFPIVGIGASAGGVAAFESFFSAMPQHEDTGMAFVLVQHLSPDHKSVLVELLKRHTRMPVFEAADGMVVRPDCAYIIPPSHDLQLVGGALRLKRHDEQRRPRLTIDHFFTSLAAEQHERAICIVMSGTGSDGTAGLREIKGEGGLAIAQSPESAEYDGMPSSAIATGMVDYVLAPPQMPAQLMSYVRHAFVAQRQPAASAEHRDSVLKRLCLLLRAQTGHDFTQYKETTLVRRLERRMALHQVAQADDYLRYARDNPKEVEALFRDLLIGVTHFFRDPDVFKLLEEKVLPTLLSRKASGEPLRVWVCGCSTGEEAYTLAMLLYERMLASKLVPKVNLFATDIDHFAIEHARAGIYPASIAAHVSEERLNRFFTHDAQRGTYRIQKHVRDMMVFSEQDVIKDPPFSKLDLISCRNLLIYLNADLQRKLIPLFHYALVPGGALLLGTSESVGESAHLFQVVDRKCKLYYRLPGDMTLPHPALPDFVPPLTDRHGRRPLRVPPAGDKATTLRQITERALLAHSGHAGLLIDAHGQILHIVGRTGQFLEPADGDAAMNILAMAREGLRRELSVALHKAVAHRELVTYRGLRVKANGEHISANLAVRPLDDVAATVLYLVVLEELPQRPSPGEPPPHDDAHLGRLAELENELRAKDDYLQTTLEEMETTNEELKSTNEELQSVNEEMQSTNEELETSKEELQSVNEELSTVNAELQDKVNDLSHANNDMNNLLAGTGIGTVFVDHHVRISRFTPAATPVINLITSDVGRPLAHVATNIVGYDAMIDDIAAVIETLVPREAEVQVKGGAWYLMRIRPYRTIDNLIEGAVVTLVDISARKKTEESLRHSEARLSAFIHQAYAGVCEADLEGRIHFVNDRLCDMLGYSRDELLRLRLSDITDAGDFARLQAQFEQLVGGAPGIQVDKRYVRKDGTRVPALDRVSTIRDASGKPRSLLLLSFEPVLP
jgi:two-component system CheB/CheR fusion protein